MAAGAMIAVEHEAAADDRAIAEAVVGRFLALWNTHRMEQLGAILTAEAHWVNTVGMHWAGRDQVVAAHIAFHQGMFKTVGLRLEAVESAIRVADAVVTAVCRMAVDGFKTPTGDRPPSRDRLTLVLAREDGAWRIAHGANVPIFEQAQAHNPVG